MGGSDVGYPTLIVRLAYGYVRVLVAAELLLFASSLLLHGSALLVGPNEAYSIAGSPLFASTVVAWIAVVAFTKGGMWPSQVKTCPKWMWKGALTIGGYGLSISCFQALFSRASSVSELDLAFSGFPLGFDAVSLCILYSVLRSDYLGESEVVRKTGSSIIALLIVATLFLAHRAGYLPRPGAGA